jgi:transposase
MSDFQYKAFVGIDISKEFFDVAEVSAAKSKRFPNSSEGFAALVKEQGTTLTKALVVLETTGGYERDLLYWLCARGFAVHRADTRKVKQFVRSLGVHGKTDALDAKALAHYAQERHLRLKHFSLSTAIHDELRMLASRRNDLVAMLVQEKNRSASPGYADILKEHVLPVIKALQKQLLLVDQAIDALICQDKDLCQKRQVMQTVAGVGAKTANSLLINMPELGTMTRRQVASLAGLAPHPCDSGSLKGRRSVKGGRHAVRVALYMAAMSARNTRNSRERAFYEKLVANGKRPIIALTALMRKLIVILNAKLRDINVMPLNYAAA